jgi:hypothetical protein
MPSKMPIPSILSPILSWRTAAILLALINLKSLPFAWHIRLLYRLITNMYQPVNVRQTLQRAVTNGTIHPIFDSVSIFSHTPMLDSDYNMHKSNSTYFADLDESRTALMTKLYLGGMRAGSERLEKDGYKGKTTIALGAVHTSFHKEIVPYEQYEVRSRVLGWDDKWCVIGSFFIRPAKRGRDEVLLASSLSKYVVKKGRFTVAPERCFTAAGWLPRKPEGCQAGPQEQKAHKKETSNGSESSNDTVILASDAGKTPSPDAQSLSQAASNTPSDAGIAAPAPEAVFDNAGIVDKLEKVASHITGEASDRGEASNADEASTTASASHITAEASDAADPPNPVQIATTTPPRRKEWDWHQIDMERIRGFRLAEGWLALDKELQGEFRQGERGD